MKRYRIVSVFLLCLVFSLVALPCFGLELTDSDAVSRGYYHYGSQSGNYDALTKLFQEDLYFEGSGEFRRSYEYNPGYAPNYLRSVFDCVATGLPYLIKAGEQGEVTISNFFISYLISDTRYYLSSVNRITFEYVYTDNTREQVEVSTSSFYGSNSDRLNAFVFDYYAKKNVRAFNFYFYYNTSNFGLPMFTSSTDLEDLYLLVGFDDYSIKFEPTYSSANPGALDDYENSERELFDATSGGIGEITSVTNNLTQAFAPSSSIYRGTMFFGNFMSDLVGNVPDLNMIILVSLSIGIVTIIIGFGAEYAGRRIGHANRMRNNKNNKGG